MGKLEFLSSWVVFPSVILVCFGEIDVTRESGHGQKFLIPPMGSGQKFPKAVIKFVVSKERNDDRVLNM
ncbi:hypothetical protein M758_6G093400 [Ceratodon purpureus]|uniref:Uncharacterized protein n=1 Tax=Ceratodon purpureus TaxID=3225 RepID=A0A8T0HGR9_CERPU|nr:hypothetical protein KC19_6G096900 [Ceratodon purpureus]KAG0613308.1 hypothetical protein M758_6G093400 [Ceratodon purpureus]